MTSAATIDIHRDRRHTIDPMIYGHFLESAFFGNIEGGVFDEARRWRTAETARATACAAT